MNDIEIRPATPADFDAIWDIFSSIIEAGETYPFPPDTTRAVGHEYWLGAAATTFVAVRGRERVLGMYRIVTNQVGRGAHVANASYMVSPLAQGAGIGRLLGEHSLLQARAMGYLAMQFNYVVSTNTAAVKLWKQLGFTIVGTLPKAYRHPRLGFVDAYVMYQLLADLEKLPSALES